MGSKAVVSISITKYLNRGLWRLTEVWYLHL